MTTPTETHSPYLKFLVVIHSGLFLAWTLGGPLRASNPSLGVMRHVAAWMPYSQQRPLLMWGLLSLCAALVLVSGLSRRNYQIRLGGWVVSQLTLGFIAISLAISAFQDPRASIAGPCYVAGLMCADYVAMTREKRDL